MIRVSRSKVGTREAVAAGRVILRGFLGTGVETQRFELALEHFLGYPVVCTVNGTSAIQLALQALGVGMGDEVLVPSLTYIATFQAISATGARPVSCDVNPDNLGICLSDARSKVTKKTAAIVPVHFGGELTNRQSLSDFAREHNLFVVEDAAHAFGSLESDGEPPKPIDLIAYSFDGIKNITSGEGGCVVGVDRDLIQRISDLRLLGVVGDTVRRYSGQRSWDFDVVEQGWRYHMSDIMAAIGRVQLKRFKVLAKKRQKLAAEYELLLSNSSIRFFPRDYRRTVPHIFPILLPAGVERTQVASRLLEKGVEVGRHYKPNHLLTKFSDVPKSSLPVTEDFASRILSLPLHPGLKVRQQRFIVRTLMKVVES